MSLNAKNIPGKKFERPDPLEPGTYPARLQGIIALGMQEQRPYKGEEKEPRPEVHFNYELLDEFMTDEDGNEDRKKPRWISETLPMHNLEADLAKSTKRYYALDPKAVHNGDWAALINTPCMLTIVANEGKGKNAGTIYNNISGVSSMRAKEAANAGELVHAPVVFDIDEPDADAWNRIPEWLQKKIRTNLEFEGSALETWLEEMPDTDDEDEEDKEW